MTDEKSISRAFPCNEFIDHVGLTKREWFAGMALQGMIATMATFKNNDGTKAENEQDFAKLSFQYADAMIAVGK